MSDQNKKQNFDKQEDLRICKELINEELAKNDQEIDTDAMERWVDEALQLQGIEYHADEQADKEELQQVFASFATSEQQNVSEKPRRRVKKIIIGIVAAAILLAALSMVTYGGYGAPDWFIKNIKQILQLERGEKLTISEDGKKYDIYNDNQAKRYDTYEEFTQAENISILMPENIPLTGRDKIVFAYDGAIDTNSVRCHFANDVEMEVFLARVSYFPEDVMEKQEDIEKLQAGRHKCYVIDNSSHGLFQMIFFDGEYTYTLVSSSRQAMIETISAMK